jgi:hypothetical protein
VSYPIGDTVRQAAYYNGRLDWQGQQLRFADLLAFVPFFSAESESATDFMIEYFKRSMACATLTPSPDMKARNRLIENALFQWGSIDNDDFVARIQYPASCKALDVSVTRSGDRLDYKFSQ